MLSHKLISQVALGLTVAALVQAVPSTGWAQRSFSGRRGGSAVAGGGSWAARGPGGQTRSGSYGTTANGTRYASGSNGGAVATKNGAWGATRNGQVAYGGVSGRGYGGAYPPAVVNQYYGSGCYNCGGWAGGGAAVTAGMAGLAAGAALNARAQAEANAQAIAYGTTYAVLPAGCSFGPVNGSPYYACGSTWLVPYYGANGTYYRVSPPP